MLVDGCWVLLGSANWDPRSLRLNFEFNLECYDLGLAQRIEELVVSKLKVAHLVTLPQVDARPLPVRLGDGLARLLTPYL
jgi:cardiolipin synthase